MQSRLRRWNYFSRHRRFWETFSCQVIGSSFVIGLKLQKLRVLTVDDTSVVSWIWIAGQTVAGDPQYTLGLAPLPPPPPPPPPSLQLSYVDQTVPHFTQIPQMFRLYYQGREDRLILYRLLYTHDAQQDTNMFMFFLYSLTTVRAFSFQSSDIFLSIY